MQHTKYGTAGQRPTSPRSSSPVCGIYCITHLPTGKSYVGQSHDIEKRWREHGSRRSGIGDAIRRHGRHEFSFEILSIVPHALLDEYEAGWIELLGTLEPFGFNRRTGGTYNSRFSETAIRRGKATRQSKREAKRQRELADWRKFFTNRRTEIYRKRVHTIRSVHAKRAKTGVFA